LGRAVYLLARRLGPRQPRDPSLQR
jgi:hypothetical protein